MLKFLYLSAITIRSTFTEFKSNGCLDHEIIFINLKIVKF